MPKSDWTTKALLVIIALGVWLNIWIMAGALSDIRTELVYLREWALAGAPVTLGR